VEADLVRSVRLSVAALVLLAPAVASAAAPGVCTDSYEQAQLLRKQGKLVAARAQLRVCSQPSCPGLIVNDCTQWTDEVQATLPSVVPVATDEAGANLVGVRVSIDGVLLESVPAGQAVDLDPGTHRFVFERADLAKTETDVLVAVGQKNKIVMVTLKRPPVATEAAGGRPSYLGTLGLVIAGVGIAAVGVGVGFGVAAISKQSDANCPSNECRPGSNPADLRTAGSNADVSTAFFIAGGVLAAAGVTTWLLAPSRHAEGAAWLRATPWTMANGAGFAVSGGW
jgi:hypothetical protein